jgi:hypothetical protein
LAASSLAGRAPGALNSGPMARYHRVDYSRGLIRRIKAATDQIEIVLRERHML